MGLYITDTTPGISCLDKGDFSFFTVLDPFAAFDTVDHTTLMHSLNSLHGMSGPPLDWFWSYFRDRTHVSHCKWSSPHSLWCSPRFWTSSILVNMDTKSLSSLIQIADDSQLYTNCSLTPTHIAIQSRYEGVCQNSAYSGILPIPPTMTVMYGQLMFSPELESLSQNIRYSTLKQ